jgi:hypothetical protein
VVVVAGLDASARAVAAGALLPDLPIFAFYAFESLRGVGEATIWGERYYAPAWQAFLHLPNSFPLLALGGSIGWCWKKPGLCLLFGSMALHTLFDFPFHHDDGHRHFWPFSEFRFNSPVSYWDPAHYGDWMIGLEFILVLALSACILRRHPQVGARIAAGIAAAAWGAGWLYARWVWA